MQGMELVTLHGEGCFSPAVGRGGPLHAAAWNNAERLTRLGVARTIARHRYTPARAAAELRALLDNPVYRQRASEVGEQVRQEDGVRAACDALEGLLRAARPE